MIYFEGFLLRSEQTFSCSLYEERIVYFLFSFLNCRILTLEDSSLKMTYIMYSVYSIYMSFCNRFHFYYCCIWGRAWRVRNEAESRRQFIVKLMPSSSVIQNVLWVRITEIPIHNIFMATPSCYLYSNQRVKTVILL